jgi:Lrp/AsnC family transcriptional regulator, leucine-responsive regulatory protein
MEHQETLVDELAGFGSTTTSVVYSQTLPYRGPASPDAGVSPSAARPREPPKH